MGILDNIFDSIAWRMANILTDRGKEVISTREFRQGKQPRQLKVRYEKGQFDDNLIINFTGLVEDRTVSQMFGTGIKLDFEGDESVKTPQEEYILGMLDANHSQKLFHNAKQYAGDAGTGYFKIIEEGITGEDGIVYPRIIALDPAFLTIETAIDDIDLVTKYVVQYSVKNGNKDIIKREVAELQEDKNWLVTESQSLDSGKKFEQISSAVFDYCPIIHWQNLPKAGSQYGVPDIKDTDKELQNRLNFISSNISKITRLYAHPMRYVVNGSLAKNPDAGPDSLLSITGGSDTSVGQFEPLGDLNAAMSFLKFLKQCYFDITRTVDIDSLEDKLGALTNFALKVIYQDNESKINTMRLMMGEAIETVIMRCQRLGGFEPLTVEIIWPEFIPVNDQERSQMLREEVDAGLLDKNTAISELGRDPDQINERIQAESEAQDNIGARLLNDFITNRTIGG